MREGAGGRKLLLVILFNAIITAAEYAGGVLSGSLALISDAGHNLADVLSLALGYAGERVSREGPSRRYTFGLKRFEVLVALVNALSLVAIGLYIIYEAVERYMNPVPVDPSIMLPVALVGLAGNVFSILVLNRSRNDNLTCGRPSCTSSTTRSPRSPSSAWGWHSFSPILSSSTSRSAW